jgi:hypothetical protein
LNLYAVRQQDVLRVIGRLSDKLLADVEQALKVAFDLG